MASTYLTNTAVRQALDQATANQASHNTSILGIWNTILSTQFPTYQGYIVSPREHGWPNSRELWYDLQVQHVRDRHANSLNASIHSTQPFLIVICRTAAEQPDENDGAADWPAHLELYLDTVYGKRRRWGRPRRVYGVIAHGMGATFFSYDVGQDIPMLIFREHEIDEKGAYHLVEDAEVIQGFLDTIRARR